MNMNIGENIIKLRKEKNMTQEDLARKVFLSPKTISSYERNRSLPKMEILILLAKNLDCTIEDILGIRNDNNEEIKEKYEKESIKETIKKTLFLGIIFVIPMLFFMYGAYISISFLAASSEIGNLTILDSAKEAFSLFLSYTYEYFIYIIIMIINYVLYKKKCVKSLFIINGLLVVILLIDILTAIAYKFTQFDLLIFLIAALFGLVYGVILIHKKKTIKL